MRISAFVGGPLATAGYLVYKEPGSEALLVDAPLGSSKRYREAVLAHSLRPLFLVNTHGHGDHAADNVALVKAFGVELCAHAWDSTRLAHPEYANEDEPAMPIAPSTPNHYLQDGEVLKVGNYSFTVMHTPGHTPGSVCLYEPAAGVLFTGDTLYRQGVGRADTPGGNPRQLGESLKKLAALPGSTRVYPGHGLTTTIGEERWLLELATAEISK